MQYIVLTEREGLRVLREGIQSCAHCSLSALANSQRAVARPYQRCRAHNGWRAASTVRSPSHRPNFARTQSAVHGGPRCQCRVEADVRRAVRLRGQVQRPAPCTAYASRVVFRLAIDASVPEPSAEDMVLLSEPDDDTAARDATATRTAARQHLRMGP